MKENKNRLSEIIEVLKNSNILHDHSPENVRLTIEKLGSTYIKIGQILSTRVDFLPMEYCNELSKLRSDVTPMSYLLVKEILNKVYPNFNEIFSDVSPKPIGSASIAQVHRAKLINGERVVIKIKRVDIDEQLDADIKLMKKAINMLHLDHFIPIINLSDDLDEVYKVTKEELDFNKEVDHILTFKKNNDDNPYIYAPHVYTEYTTKSTIVMEEVRGIKINDIESLKNEYNLSNVAAVLSDNYIKQALDDGMFHADPHPDNILVSDDRVVFIDWGMVGSLKPRNRDLLKECMKSIIVEDYQQVATILISMSTKTGDVSLSNLTSNIEDILTNVGDTSLQDIDTKEFITNMFKMLQNNNLILDHDVTMLIRGIGILEGVLEQLDSSISLIQVLKEHVLDSEVLNISSTDFLKKVGKKVYQNGKSLINFPSEAESLLKEIKDGDFKFKFEMSDSSKHVDKIEALIHELIIGFIDGCLIISVSFISDISIRFIFVIFIILLSSWLLIKMLIDSNHKGY